MLVDGRDLTVADFHSAFFCRKMSRARLCYCLNRIIFHFIPHGSSEDKTKSRARDILRLVEIRLKVALRTKVCSNYF